MSYIEPEYEYELKCEQIAMQIEMLVLNSIISVLERLSNNLESITTVTTQNQKPSEDIYPF